MNARDCRGVGCGDDACAFIIPLIIRTVFLFDVRGRARELLI